MATLREIIQCLSLRLRKIHNLLASQKTKPIKGFFWVGMDFWNYLVHITDVLQTESVKIIASVTVFGLKQNLNSNSVWLSPVSSFLVLYSIISRQYFQISVIWKNPKNQTVRTWNGKNTSKYWEIENGLTFEECDSRGKRVYNKPSHRCREVQGLLRQQVIQSGQSVGCLGGNN